MKQVNINDFYTLGHTLHPLSELTPGKPLKEYFVTLVFARHWAWQFANDQIIPMTICKSAVWKIYNGITAMIPVDPAEFGKIDMEREVTYTDLYKIIDGVKEFETVFAAEVQNMATYFVSKKGIYDTNDLIARADNLFADSVKQYMSEQAKLDIREAGKCMAFDLATASGFHIARAVESVLVEYLNALCPTVMAGLKESQRNVGNYIRMASDNDGDGKVCNSLDQFRDLHRNPLIHPESVLTIDDALALLGIAQSAIIAMTLEIARLKGKPAPLPGVGMINASALLLGGGNQP